MELGCKLRKIRKSRGLSLEEVSKSVDMDIGYLSKLERNQINFPINKIKILVNFYDIELEELFKKDCDWTQKIPEKLKKYVKEENIPYLEVGYRAKELGYAAKDAKKIIDIFHYIKNK